MGMLVVYTMCIWEGDVDKGEEDGGRGERSYTRATVYGERNGNCV